MTDETFLTRVQREMHSDDTIRATEASIAVLRTLAASLSADQARALADRLPPALGRSLGVDRPSGGQHAVGAGD